MPVTRESQGCLQYKYRTPKQTKLLVFKILYIVFLVCSSQGSSVWSRSDHILLYKVWGRSFLEPLTCCWGGSCSGEREKVQPVQRQPMQFVTEQGFERLLLLLTPSTAGICAPLGCDRRWVFLCMSLTGRVWKARNVCAYLTCVSYGAGSVQLEQTSPLAPCKFPRLTHKL